MFLFLLCTFKVVINLIKWCDKNSGFAEWIQTFSIITSFIVAVIAIIKYFTDRRDHLRNAINQRRKRHHMLIKNIKNNEVNFNFSVYYDKYYINIRIINTSGKDAINFIDLYKAYFTYNKLSYDVINKFYRKFNNLNYIHQYFKDNKSLSHYYFSFTNKGKNKQRYKYNYIRPKKIRAKEFESLNKILIMTNNNRTYNLKIPKSDIAWTLMSGDIWTEHNYNSSILKDIPYFPRIILIFINLKDGQLYLSVISIPLTFIYSSQYKQFKHISMYYLSHNYRNKGFNKLNLPRNYYKYMHHHLYLKYIYRKYFDR